MGAQRWADLTPRSRRLIVAAAGIEGALKVVALVDLLRRPPGEIRGRKAWWVPALVLVNAVGAVPLAYLVFGRRDSARRAGSAQVVAR